MASTGNEAQRSPEPGAPGQTMAGSEVRRVWLSFGILALAAVGSVARLTPPAPSPATIPPTEVSAERALEHVNVIARERHPAGSPAHAAVRAYLVEELRKLGLTVEVQSGVLTGSPGRGVGEGQAVENILARLPGTAPTKALMLASHYDSADESFGASDAGAGVAAILETVRAVRAGPPLTNDLLVLITDAEERGLCGAIVFVREHPRVQDVGLVANFEARGSCGPSIMFETSDGNGRLVEGFAAAASHPCTTSLAYEVYRRLPNDTDLTVFKAAGLPGLNFAFIGGLEDYHAPTDDVAHLDRRTLEHHCRNAHSVVRAFGNADLRDLVAPNLVYFDLLGAFVVRYPGGLALPLALAAAAAWAVAAWRARREGRLALGKAGLGLLAALLAIALAAAAVWGAWRLALWLHAPNGFRATIDFSARPALFYGVALLVLGTFTLALEFPLRRLGVWNVALGGGFVWVGLALGTAGWFEGASYLFTWPLFFAVAGAACDPRVPSGGRVAFAIPAIALFAPTLWLFFLAMTLHAAPVLAAVAAVGLLPAVPVLEALPARHRVILGCVAAAAGALAMLA